MDFVIAIPTHNRNKMLRDKTLKFLSRQNISQQRIFIFPSNSTDFENREGEHYNIVRNEDNDSILKARNTIVNYFSEGTKILEMDDDINYICKFGNMEVSNFQELIINCFKKCGDGIFGFNAGNNDYYWTNDERMGLMPIIGSCCGYTNDKSIILTLKEKEDYERVIMFYERGKLPYKFCQYGIKTRYWKNKGGIQDRYDFEERLKVQAEVANYLVRTYPHYCYARKRRNGLVDIRFKVQKHCPIEIYTGNLL